MVIDLKQLYEIVGDSIPIDTVVSEERLNEINGYSFKGPVTLKGILQNRAGIVTFNYTVSLMLSALCDRCLGELERSLSFEFEHILVNRLYSDDNDEYVVTEKDKLDLDELAVQDMLPEMPTKLLCKEDCKGLCPNCGADLNISDCSCNG